MRRKCLSKEQREKASKSKQKRLLLPRHHKTVTRRRIPERRAEIKQCKRLRKSQRRFGFLGKREISQTECQCLATKR